MKEITYLIYIIFWIILVIIFIISSIFSSSMGIEGAKPTYSEKKTLCKEDDVSA
jgi:uncharacterized protein YpmB